MSSLPNAVRAQVWWKDENDIAVYATVDFPDIHYVEGFVRKWHSSQFVTFNSQFVVPWHRFISIEVYKIVEELPPTAIAT